MLVILLLGKEEEFWFKELLAIYDEFEFIVELGVTIAVYTFNA
jgi:hypothetical protein